MATLSPTVLKYPRTGQGGGTSVPPGFGGGGDGHNGGAPDYGGRLRRARLGLAVGLTPVIMLFVSFTSAYIVRQGMPTLDVSTSTYIHDWLPVNLPWILLAVNTVILLISSGTMEMARRQVIRETALAPVKSIPGVSLGNERQFPWLGVTAVLGLAFLVGQWEAWKELAARGFYLATSASSSFVYLLTGIHAVHLAGGVIALLYATLASLLRKPIESRRIVVDIAAWYWHFMALLWLYIFALIEIAR